MNKTLSEVELSMQWFCKIDDLFLVWFCILKYEFFRNLIYLDCPNLQYFLQVDIAATSSYYL